MQVSRNRTSRATAKIEHRGAGAKTFNKTVMPRLFVPSVGTAVGLKGQGVSLVMIDNVVGGMTHIGNLAAIDGLGAASAPNQTQFAVTADRGAA